MQELRLVAVSEDGSYLVLATAGRGTRFTLPVDDRLRAAVRGHFSRLGQFEIEVESALRPKEIQARIRAGETAEEIAESAGIPVERVRWFEGPVLQEREYMAQQAQRCVVRTPGEPTPGPPLGEMVEARLGRRGADLEEVQWDSWKCEDNTWKVRLSFYDAGRPHAAEWKFDPRRRSVMPADDEAARLTALTEEQPPPAEVTPLRRPAMKIVSDQRRDYAPGRPFTPRDEPAAPESFTPEHFTPERFQRESRTELPDLDELLRNDPSLAPPAAVDPYELDAQVIEPTAVRPAAVSASQITFTPSRPAPKPSPADDSHESQPNRPAARQQHNEAPSPVNQTAPAGHPNPASRPLSQGNSELAGNAKLVSDSESASRPESVRYTEPANRPEPVRYTESVTDSEPTTEAARTTPQPVSETPRTAGAAFQDNAQVAAAEAQPTHAHPAQSQPAQPGQAHPSHAQSGQQYPAQTQSGQPQPAQSQPAQPQAAQPQAAQAQPGPTQPAQTQPAQAQPSQAEPVRAQAEAVRAEAAAEATRPEPAASQAEPMAAPAAAGQTRANTAPEAEVLSAPAAANSAGANAAPANAPNPGAEPDTADRVPAARPALDSDPGSPAPARDQSVAAQTAVPNPPAHPVERAAAAAETPKEQAEVQEREEPEAPAPVPTQEEPKAPAAAATPPKAERPRKRPARNRRASVPSWDEIMFGARRPD